MTSTTAIPPSSSISSSFSSASSPSMKSNNNNSNNSISNSNLSPPSLALIQRVKASGTCTPLLIPNDSEISFESTFLALVSNLVDSNSAHGTFLLKNLDHYLFSWRETERCFFSLSLCRVLTTTHTVLTFLTTHTQTGLSLKNHSGPEFLNALKVRMILFLFCLKNCWVSCMSAFVCVCIYCMTTDGLSDFHG